MNKKFKVEYNPTNDYNSEWFTEDDLIEAENEEEAIELAKDYNIEMARANGYTYEKAAEIVNSYAWRAKEELK